MAARINQAAPHPVQDLPTTDKHYPPQTAFFYFQLSIFWFALSFLWAGMITIVIQNLVAQMTGNQKDLYLGWTLAIGAFVSTIIGLLAGTLSDRSRWKMGKRRPYMIVGTLCVLPALFWLAHVHSIPALMVDFCLIQFWTTLATSPYQALVPDLVPKERQGTASAYMGMGSLLGQLGGLILCGLLITKPGGLAQIMYTLMILLTGAMLFTVWRVPEVSAASPSEGTGSSQLLQAVRDSFRFNAREHPDFFRLIASRFIINMGFYSATEFLLYYVQDSLHTPQPKATAIVTRIFVITTVSGLLGNFPAGILSDRISKKKVVYASTILTGVAALVFLLTTSITVALVAAFIFGAGFGAFAAVDWAFVTTLLPDHDEARYMGIWHVAFTVPQVVAPLIGGLIAYFFNQHVAQGFGYRVVLFVVLIYLLVGTMMIRPIREHVPSRKI